MTAARSATRPIEVVVLNCCVTETKDTPCLSSTSMNLAKSRWPPNCERAVDSRDRDRCRESLAVGFANSDPDARHASDAQAETLPPPIVIWFQKSCEFDLRRSHSWCRSGQGDAVAKLPLEAIAARGRTRLGTQKDCVPPCPNTSTSASLQLPAPRNRRLVASRRQER